MRLGGVDLVLELGVSLVLDDLTSFVRHLVSVCRAVEETVEANFGEDGPQDTAARASCPAQCNCRGTCTERGKQNHVPHEK